MPETAEQLTQCSPSDEGQLGIHVGKPGWYEWTMEAFRYE